MATHAFSVVDLWSAVCARYRPGEILVASTVIVQLFGFIIPAAIYHLIDVAFPLFSRRHKIQEQKRQPSQALVRHCVAISLFNNIWPLLILYATCYTTRFQWSPFTITGDLPSIRTIITDFAIGVVVREIIFYYVHRILHHPKLYPYIHKKHHKYTTPVAFAAEYAHPVEHLIANQLPIILPLALKDTHILSFLVFMLFELWEAAADHSGYDFLKLPPAEMHDLHHAKFRVNYGTIGLMDWVHGTDVVGWDKPKKLAKAHGAGAALVVEDGKPIEVS